VLGEVGGVPGEVGVVGVLGEVGEVGAAGEVGALGGVGEVGAVGVLGVVGADDEGGVTAPESGSDDPPHPTSAKQRLPATIETPNDTGFKLRMPHISLRHPT